MRACSGPPHDQHVSTFPLDLDPLAIPNPPPPEPAEIRAGDTLQRERASDDYPAAEGYSLSYVFVNRTTNYAIGGAMVTNGPQNYEVTVPAATTAARAAGWYRWQAYITDSSTPPNRWTVGEGEAQVLPNLQVLAGGFDDREPDEIMLDAVVALMSNKVLTDARSTKSKSANCVNTPGKRSPRFAMTWKPVCAPFVSGAESCHPRKQLE